MSDTSNVAIAGIDGTNVARPDVENRCNLEIEVDFVEECEERSEFITQVVPACDQKDMIDTSNVPIAGIDDTNVSRPNVDNRGNAEIEVNFAEEGEERMELLTQVMTACDH